MIKIPNINSWALNILRWPTVLLTAITIGIILYISALIIYNSSLITISIIFNSQIDIFCYLKEIITSLYVIINILILILLIIILYKEFGLNGIIFSSIIMLSIVVIGYDFINPGSSLISKTISYIICVYNPLNIIDNPLEVLNCSSDLNSEVDTIDEKRSEKDICSSYSLKSKIYSLFSYN